MGSNFMLKVAERKTSLNLERFQGRTRIKEISDGRYSTRLVQTPEELEAVLGLRFAVFNRELSNQAEKNCGGLDFDEYDLKCEHLIVIETETGKAVGTYRLNTLETAGDAEGFYAFSEFSIESLPPDILERSVELGRACISKDHRNSRVLFMLWKGLADYLNQTKKRYLFGCCSIFTQDGNLAGNILNQLRKKGHLHETIRVAPRFDKICIPENFVPKTRRFIALPALVNIYLRIGAKICGDPAIDRNFKTIDYFVLFDLKTISPKYLRMFFGEVAPRAETRTE